MLLQSVLNDVTRKLGWHPQRSLTFIALILGLIHQGSVQHHRMCVGFETSKTFKAHLERIRRFFKYQMIHPLTLSHTLLFALFNRIPKMDLILDRTNWKFGKTDINYLVLAARIHKRIVFPVGWIALSHQGNSDEAQRIKLLTDFHSIFGFECIRSFTADREFIGSHWLQYMCTHDISFTIRMRRNLNVPFGKTLKKPLSFFFDHLQTDEERFVLKEIAEHELMVVGKKLPNGEMLILCSNRHNKQAILDTYQKRWDIERMFKNLKTQGFNMEDTHMTCRERLSKLMSVVGMATFWMCFLGLSQKCAFKKTVNAPLYSVFTRGLRVFRLLFYNNPVLLQNQVSKILECLLKSEG